MSSGRIPVREAAKAWLKDPEFRAEYDALEPEFALAFALIEARSRAGMTQAQVAEAMGTTQAVIARLEGGRVKPSTRTLERFANATGTRLCIHFEPIRRQRDPQHVSPSVDARARSGAMSKRNASGMTNYSTKKFLETQESLGRQLKHVQTTIKALETNSSLRKLIEEANRDRELMRTVLGPLEELRRTGLLAEASQLTAASRQARDLMAQVQSSFRLPEIAEAKKLLRESEASGLAKSLERYRTQTAEIRRAMEAMRTPWLDTQNQLRSITGFAELQGIGHALRAMPPFDVRVTRALRLDLGDWQTKIINWPSEIFTDPVARTAFYSERGLNPALTAFPTEAFEQSLRIAGLTGTPPPLIQAYSAAPDAEREEDEVAFERTNAAHEDLIRFETQIRKFIDDRMKAAFGDSWIKRRVPGEIRKSWLDKQQKARDNGEAEWPLIAYADFADYVPIITRKDNWEKVFKPFFRRQIFVQEAFQRLYPIRICTMHARLITQDDELYLHVETKRILSAIGVAT